MNNVIIVQARMTSSRLPGKILLSVLDKSLLEYQIERLRRVKLASNIVIATTTNTTDQPIIELCERLDVAYFRGSESDVLSRYYQAAQAYKADTVIRITSDCPLIDPEIIDKVITAYTNNKADYVSNVFRRSYPRGMDTEVFSWSALQKAYSEAKNDYEREHVTPFIYENPNLFKLGQVENELDYSQHRWTVDTIEDFTLVKNIIEVLYPGRPYFTMQDVLDVFEIHPEWMEINAAIEQKKLK